MSIPAIYLGIKQNKYTFAVIYQGKTGYLHFNPDTFHPVPQFVSIGDEGVIVNNRFFVGQVVDLIEKTPEQSVQVTPPAEIDNSAVKAYTEVLNNNEPTIKEPA